MSSRSITWRAGITILFVTVFMIGAIASPAFAAEATPRIKTPPANPHFMLHQALAQDTGLVWLAQQTSADAGAANDRFGTSVAVSGATAVIGVSDATVNGNYYQGEVFVFNESNGVWTQTQRLTANDGAGSDHFGSAVALDGTTVLIGAPGANVNGTPGQGAVYVFSDSAGTWIQTQKLVASDGVNGDNLGNALAIGGTTALVGAKGATVNGNALQGAVYVFTQSNGTWTQEQKLVANDGAGNDLFGQSLVLDGTTALIGAPTLFYNYLHAGWAYVFDNVDGTWVQTQKLIPSDSAVGNQFGYSVALAGETALVGANGNNFSQGAAYAFTDSDGVWTQTQKLAPADGAGGDDFGNAMALSGTSVVIGADRLSIGDHQGAAYVFTESNGAWSEAREFTESEGSSLDFFGSSLSFDGTSVLVGAPGATVGDNQFQGMAYFYGKGDLSLVVSAPETVKQGRQYISQTIATNNASATSPAVTATMTVPAAASFVSATATQGSCSETSGVVTCDFGPVSGNAGTATANVTLRATGNVGNTIDNTASIAHATPPLSASAPTQITEGGACPAGYTEHDGTLAAGKRVHSPIYRAPAGEENAILTGPSGFQLYAVFQNAQGRKIFRIPGNEVHRRTPAGTYAWVVKAGASGGAYTLCIMHP